MRAELDRLEEEIRGCRICIDEPRGRQLPHEPRPVVWPSTTATILIAGQAPGTKVHLSGIPFTDASGDRLRSWLGVSRDEFYDRENFAIVPMGFCFPGQDARGADLPPRPECAPAWQSRLMRLMPQIELVLPVGLHAQGWHMGPRRAGSLTDTVRDWSNGLASSNAPKVLPLPHPSWRNTSWLKRNPWFETDLLPALRSEVRGRLKSRSGKTILLQAS
jgi:uracil-DNA glycosylase